MVTGIVPTYFRSQVPYSGTRFVELSLQKRKKWHVTFAPMVLILMLELIVERLQVFAWLHSVTLTHIWALSRDHKTSFTEYKLLKSTRFMLSPRHAFLIGLVKGSRYRISICIKHASTRHRRRRRRLTESNFYGVKIIISHAAVGFNIHFFDAVTEFQCSFISSFNQYQHGIWPIVANALA